MSPRGSSCTRRLASRRAEGSRHLRPGGLRGRPCTCSWWCHSRHAGSCSRRVRGRSSSWHTRPRAWAGRRTGPCSRSSSRHIGVIVLRLWVARFARSRGPGLGIPLQVVVYVGAEHRPVVGRNRGRMAQRGTSTAGRSAHRVRPAVRVDRTVARRVAQRAVRHRAGHGGGRRPPPDAAGRRLLVGVGHGDRTERQTRGRWSGSARQEVIRRLTLAGPGKTLF